VYQPPTARVSTKNTKENVTMSFDFNKIFKDLQDSAKEFASTGLTLGSKALDAAATQLKTIQAVLQKNADKLATKAEDVKVDAPKQ
jgi:hypothetical protein